MKKTFLITVEERPTTRKVAQVRPGSSKRGRPARLVPTSTQALGISLFGPIGTSKAVEVLAGFPNINQDALQTFIASELQAGETRSLSWRQHLKRRRTFMRRRISLAPLPWCWRSDAEVTKDFFSRELVKWWLKKQLPKQNLIRTEISAFSFGLIPSCRVIVSC